MPPGIVATVTRLMEVDPARRYQSPTQVIGDLRPMVGRRNSGAALTPGSAEHHSEAPTVLCVERRHKQQDWLREYLTRHDYRVLLLSDMERALMRMKNNPPDCVILMGGSIGESLGEDFHRAQRLAETTSTVLVVVLSERQGQLTGELETGNGLVRVLQQPIRLRDLRESLAAALDERGNAHK